MNYKRVAYVLASLAVIGVPSICFGDSKWIDAYMVWPAGDPKLPNAYFLCDDATHFSYIVAETTGFDSNGTRQCSISHQSGSTQSTACPSSTSYFVTWIVAADGQYDWEYGYDWSGNYPVTSHSDFKICQINNCSASTCKIRSLTAYGNGRSY